MVAVVAVASNSGGINPQTHPEVAQDPIDVGIDKLALSFPISGFRKDRPLWDEVWDYGAKLNDCFAGAWFSIRISRIRGNLRCRVEFNPSRVLDPYGWSLCRPEEVFSTLSLMHNQLRARMDYLADTGDMRVTRLDVARDFKVADPQFFITGLVHLPRPYSRNPCVYFDEKTGAASSLRLCTSKSSGAKRPNHVQLYDKCLQTGRGELRGVLRWEVQARTWAEQYGGIKTLADLTPERVRHLALDRWKWSRMGEPVVGPETFVHRAHAAEWSSDPVRQRFIGQYFELLHGKLAFNEKSREAFNKTQRELGISLGDGPGPGRLLDFETGTEALAEPEVPEVPGVP